VESNRFGLGATLARLPWRLFGSVLYVQAELVYTDYRLIQGTGDASAALAGAAAFAAGVEASAAIVLRWGGGLSP
jgi:hypothetical protein